MKKSISAFLTAVLVTGMLAGCGGGSEDNKPAAEAGSSSAPGQKVTIKYYTWEDKPGYKEKIAEFEKMYPNIKVETQVLASNDARESTKKLDILTAAGEQVDVLRFSNADHVIQRAATGMLAPIDDFAKEDNLNINEEYYANTLYKGKTYSLMDSMTFWFVVLNKQHLDETGLPIPPSDWTWDDFRDYAKKLTKPGRYGAYFHTWGEYANAIAYSELPNPYVDKSLKPLFNHPSYTYFFNLRKQMEREDKSTEPLADVITVKYGSSSQFLAGKASMQMVGSFILANVFDTAKYPHDFKTVFAPMPRSSKEAPTGYTNIGGEYLAIGANSKHKKESYQFIRFITSTGGGTKEGLQGWKKSDGRKAIQNMAGDRKHLIDETSLLKTVYDESVKTATDSSIDISYGQELKKDVLESLFSKFMLENTRIEDIQKEMNAQAEKVAKQAE